MKKLLIGGCSFSQQTNGTENPFWKSWTDFLSEDYDKQLKIINTAESSFGQSLIIKSLMEQLIELDFKVDMVIVQWSAVARGYSTNQDDFVKRIMNQGDFKFAAYQEEYVNGYKGVTYEYEGWVTDNLNVIDLEYYTSSIDKIILFKYLLETHNIPYVMFWGWEQITPEIYQKKKKWLDIMYNENFWTFGKHGGMLEWIVDKIGKENAYVSPNDFHPSTQGHELFYNQIIKDIINTKIL